MSNKTIKINPALFSVGGSSKKNKKQKPTNVPLISPNVLKNKLLNRIKAHKKKETSELDSNKNNTKNNTDIKIQNDKKENNIENFTDEFNDSIEYLQSLSKQQKVNTENENKKEQIQKKTIKKRNTNNTLPVNLDLPDELLPELLSETSININTNNSNNSTILPTITNKNFTDVPYGVLKGGNKPTYRQWIKTQKNYSSNNLSSNNLITDRQQRLNLLKQKIKNSNTNPNPNLNPNSNTNNLTLNNSTQEVDPIIIEEPIKPENIELIQNNSNLEEVILTQNLIQNPNQNIKEPEKIKTVKKLIKKTIHKKYTLGKSNIKRTVAVLLKNQTTRKKIIDAQKDLKKKPVNDVKTYLRQHNLIKIGSNAPTDIIRKIYESAVLAGEITNDNKDTMLYNFMKDDSNIN